MKRVLQIVGVVLAAQIPLASAAVLRVPQDYPSIQQAIDAAASGDTVLVAPGTYPENIDYRGKDLRITGEQGPQLTIIDGGSRGSVVAFRSGEGAAAVLEGFTIRNGSGSDADYRGYTIKAGGGVLCIGSSPTIQDNVIFDNNTENYGGGLYCSEGSAPLIVRNTFQSNSIYAGGGGGAIASVDSTLIIKDNVISDNSGGFSYGGALLCYSSDVTLDGNRIEGNRASTGGGIDAATTALVVVNNTIAGNWITDDDGDGGGGISMSSCSAVIAGNTFTGNTAVGDGGGVVGLDSSASIRNNTFTGNHSYPGGVVVLYSGSQSTVEDNVFDGNSAGRVGQIDCHGPTVVQRNDIRGGVIGIAASGSMPVTIANNTIRPVETGIYAEFSDDHVTISGNVITGAQEQGILLLESAPTIENNFITGGTGHAIACDHASPRILRNTIVANSSSTFGAGIYCQNLSSPTITSNILWDNQAPTGAEIYVESGDPVVTYCDVEGGWPGTGNIDADPQFGDPARGDFHLAAGSPCLDAGDPGDRAAGRDVARDPRLLDADLDGHQTVDMGAYERGNVRLGLWWERQAGHMRRVLGHDARLALDVSGTTGLSAFLLAGTVPGEVSLPPYGPLFLDLAHPWVFLSWGSVPSRRIVPLPDDLPDGVYVLQVLALAPGAGNVSNDVLLTVE
jgi:putative cofactor-binding repeat protein